MIRAQLSHPLSLVLLSAFCSACNNSPSQPSSQAPSAPSVASTSNAPALSFGQPISSKDSVSLADLARDPSAWSSKTLVTSGTVVSVCPNMGCWMVIEDQGVQAMVRMDNHSFRVPKDSSGKRARVQAVANSPAATAPFKCPTAAPPAAEEATRGNQAPQASPEASGVELF